MVDARKLFSFTEMKTQTGCQHHLAGGEPLCAFGIERWWFESCIKWLSQQYRSISRESNIQSLPFNGLSHLVMKTHNVVFTGLWAKSNGATIQMNPFRQ